MHESSTGALGSTDRNRSEKGLLLLAISQLMLEHGLGEQLAELCLFLTAVCLFKQLDLVFLRFSG